MGDNERFGGWARSRPATVDAVVVALVLAAFEMPAFDPYRHAGGPLWPFWGFAVALPLWWRRRFPVAVLAVSLAATAGAMLTRTGPDWGGLGLVAMLLGPSVALATTAAAVPIALSQRLAIVSGLVIATAGGRRSTPDVVAAQVGVIAGSWLAGEAIRARRNEIALLRDRVTQRAEQAADDERTRIARELHDVVAHHLSVIAVQAGAARLAGGEGAPGAGSLVTIEAASRHALSELRRALGVLRSDDPATGIAPQPGLDQLDRLADRLRDAGLPLELATTGDLSAIPGGIGLSAYRIVQEALTNVLNHVGRAETTVRVVCSPAEIHVCVHNGPPTLNRPAKPEGGGHGLIGMHERVAAYGGSLQAGALASGGFEVTARIPMA